MDMLFSEQGLRQERKRLRFALGMRRSKDEGKRIVESGL